MSRGSLVKALLARIEAEKCASAGHRWEPVLGGGRWCRVCQAYEPLERKSDRSRGEF